MLLLVLAPQVLFIVSGSWFPPVILSSVCTEHDKSEKKMQNIVSELCFYIWQRLSASRFVILGEGMEGRGKRQASDE